MPFAPGIAVRLKFVNGNIERGNHKIKLQKRKAPACRGEGLR